MRLSLHSILCQRLTSIRVYGKKVCNHLDWGHRVPYTGAISSSHGTKACCADMVNMCKNHMDALCKSMLHHLSRFHQYHMILCVTRRSPSSPLSKSLSTFIVT